MQKLIPLVFVGLVIGALTGCGDSSKSVAPGRTFVEGTAEDRAAVVDAATGFPEFMDDGVYEQDLPMSDQLLIQPGEWSAQAEIDPITFRRRVRVVDRNFEFAFADTDSVGRPTRAFLTVTKQLAGTFIIVADDTSGAFGSPQNIRKELTETWTRELEFVRSSPGEGDDDGHGDGGDDDGARNFGRGAQVFGNGNGRGNDGGNDHGHGGGGGDRVRWELASVSGIEVDSQDDGVEIVSVRIQGDGVDITIDDALALMPADALPTLAQGSEITVTVTTNSPDDIVLLLSRNRRVRLESNGDNTFTGTLTVPRSFGCHHFGVNALSHDTLFDDVAPYDSESWLLPIRAGSPIAGLR